VSISQAFCEGKTPDASGAKAVRGAWKVFAGKKEDLTTVPGLVTDFSFLPGGKKRGKRGTLRIPRTRGGRVLAVDNGSLPLYLHKGKGRGTDTHTPAYHAD